MKNCMCRIGVRAAAVLLAVGTLNSIPAIAQVNSKVNICHITGKGAYQSINIASSAVPAHQAHGDRFPGATISTGTPRGGLYGSTVTPVTVLGDDCSQLSVLRIDKAMNFSQNQPAGVSAGWAGWSCIESGFPKVVGGGVVPETGTIIAQGPAKDGAAAIDGYTYPVYPNYTFPTGQQGWIVEAAGATPPTGIYVLCGQ